MKPPIAEEKLKIWQSTLNKDNLNNENLKTCHKLKKIFIKTRQENNNQKNI